MIEMKRMLKNAFHTMKNHYLLLIIVCLVTGFLGTEFSLSLSSIKARMGGDGGSRSIIEKIIDEITFDKDNLQKIPSTVLDIVSGANNEADELIDEILHRVDKNSFAGQAIYEHKKELTAIAQISSAGQAVVMISSFVFEYGETGKFLTIAIIFLVFLLYEFVICFYFDVFGVAYRRVVLEGRKYKRVFAPRFIMLAKVDCWLRCGWAIVVKNVIYFLWCLTGVGAFIKRYSYYMVPYILAENPKIKPLDALTVSRKMMNGYKWKCFLYEVSFIPLLVIDLLTFGLSGILFSNPLKVSFFAELYAELRCKALKEGKINSTILSDTYLFENAPKELLEEAYDRSIEELDKKLNEPYVKYKGFRRIFSEGFGIVLYADKISKRYDENQSDSLHLARIKAARRGEAYPTRLSKLEHRYSGHWVDRINYNRQYSLTSLVWMFMIISIVGWVWEVVLHLVQTGEFVNRGSMYGPWLPIYGSGCALMLMVLKRIRGNPVIFFVSAVILCGTVEYLTSYFMEQSTGIRYWDYYGYFLNIDGRICAEGVMLFGLAGLAGIYILCPILDNVVRHFPKKIMTTLAIILALIFIYDKVYSDTHPHVGKGITVQSEVMDENATGENME